MGPRGRFLVAAGGVALGAAAWLLLVPERPAGDLSVAPVVEPAAGPATGPALSGLSDEGLRAHRARAAARWRELLEAEDPAVRRTSVHAWQRAGLEPGAAAEVLVPLLTDADPEMRRAVRDALRTIGDPAVAVLLRAGLATDDWELPAITIEVLGLLAQAHPHGSAPPALLAILADPRKNRTWRARAAMALGHVRPVGEPARAALRKAMRDPDKEVAAGAIDGLGSLGTDSEDLIPTFLAMLEDPDLADLQPEAAFALGQIGLRPATVLPALERWSAEGHGQHGVWAAARFGKGAFPWLRGLLASEDTGPKRYALFVVTEMGAAAGPLAPELLRVPSPDGWLFWHEVAAALKAMGPAARAVVPDIVAMIRKTEADTQHCHGWIDVLPALGADGETALRDLATTSGLVVRSRACSVLALGAPDSRETRSFLESVAEKDPEEQVRWSAQWALRRLPAK